MGTVCNFCRLRIFGTLYLPLGSFKRDLLKMPFYAVKRGRNPGVYSTWPECQAQVNEFNKPRFKKFFNEAEAWAFVQDTTPEKWNSPAKRSGPQTPAAPYAAPAAPYAAPPAAVQYTAAPPQPAAPMYHAPSTSAATAPPVETAAAAGPMRISSSRILALKGTINSMKALAEQFRQYVTQAEEQLEMIQRGKKRGATENGSAGSSLATDDGPPEVKRTATEEDKYGRTSSAPVTVYTDGCCHGNGRENSKAGIGVFWGHNDPMNVSERLPGRPTNNRAEIHAACRAVQQARERGISDLVIHTDSQFTINGITKWIHKWKSNGWKLASGGAVINKEDFQELDDLLADGRVNVTWVHVDAHTGIPGNEAADQLANEGARL